MVCKVLLPPSVCVCVFCLPKREQVFSFGHCQTVSPENSARLGHTWYCGVTDGTPGVMGTLQLRDEVVSLFRAVWGASGRAGIGAELRLTAPLRSLHTGGAGYSVGREGGVPSALLGVC